MEEWKKCKTWEAKREVALKLATDKTASFIRVTQSEPLKGRSEVSDVTGWLHIWEIADVDKFPCRPSDPDVMAKLMRFVSDCPSRPSEKPELAADGKLQHDYRKKQVTKHSVVRSSEVADEHKDEIKKFTVFDKTWFSGRRRSRQSAFEESALDESCERNKVDVAESSRRSRRKQWNNLKPLSRKGRAAQCSSPSPTSPR